MRVRSGIPSAAVASGPEHLYVQELAKGIARARNLAVYRYYQPSEP